MVESFLFINKIVDQLLCITDFNVAKFFDTHYKNYDSLTKNKYKMYTYTGTLSFSAPEIFCANSYWYLFFGF